MEKGEMLRVTTKQKATLSLCLNIIRTWTKSSAIEKPSILDTCWRVVRQSKPRVQIDQDIRDKQILDEEVCAAASAQKRKLVQSDDLPGPSGEVGTSDSEEDESLADRESAQVHQRVVQRIHQRIEKMERKQPERRPKQQQ